MRVVPVRVLLTIVALTGWLLSLDRAAWAHDSLAPPGASHNWLPDEEWVHRHWIPFDERAVEGELGLAPGELEAYLYNDHNTLAALARRRGLDPAALADRLIAPWTGISGDQRALLRERTLRILTQGHLAQHMFFHVFHGLELHGVSHHVFGMRASAYRALRERGLSYVAIAKRGGVSPSAIRTEVTSMLSANRSDGVARHEAWPAQSERILARTLAKTPCWLRRPPAGLDVSNPYGKNRFLHGSHESGWPATARERSADQRRVERFRQRLAQTCWRHPPRWRD